MNFSTSGEGTFLHQEGERGCQRNSGTLKPIKKLVLSVKLASNGLQSIFLQN